METPKENIQDYFRDLSLREWIVEQQLPMETSIDLYNKIRSLSDDEIRFYKKTFFLFKDHEETMKRIRFILDK